MAPVVVEVCVDSLESALAAVEGGATRLELCGNLGIGGGTTPSMGFVRSVKKALPGVDVVTMIRPRTGDFLYTDLELEIMLEDIRLFKEQGISGVALGVLLANGTVDVARTRRLVEASKPMQVCFHRAIDMTRNPLEALQAIESVGGINRILTSGYRKSAPESVLTLEALARLALEMRSSIAIMPGSGINPDSVDIITHTLWWKKMRELHLSGARWMDGSMKFRKSGMSMGANGEGEWGIWRTDAGSVREVKRKALNSLTQATLL